MADAYQAITDYEAENRNEIRVYKPGIDCKYGRLFSSPEKILCVGLNYADHAKEFGNPFQTNLLFLIKPQVHSVLQELLSFSQSNLTASTMRGTGSCHWKRRTQCPKRTSDDLCSRILLWKRRVGKRLAKGETGRTMVLRQVL